ncbi:MAG: 1,4-alpha-glucan branching protein GlgB [Bacillota bacterium]
MSSCAPTEEEIYLFHEGSLYHSYGMLGAHLREHEGVRGATFCTWAPNAREVRVCGDFNGWQGSSHPLQRISDAGLWWAFVPGAQEGHFYKYEIVSAGGDLLLKADPYAFAAERRPGDASRICSLSGFAWQDGEWLRQRDITPPYQRPLLIYEVHPGSWKRGDHGDFLSYRDLAVDLVDYASEMGYTHIELLPLAEHPFDGSWGYQATGYYAVTSRYGTPQDFMFFVDSCHHKGLGVILDWVPGHFCKNAYGLACFDGTPLYEYKDPLRRESADWDTLSFDLGRPEVISFLISNALFWFDLYHIDGLRVDAVASILYLDYGRRHGQWTPNCHGGRENLEAVFFLRRLNEQVFHYYPGALMIAEDSTQWPLVSAPVYCGGLGFNYKWNMGWMNDILDYMKTDPLYRKHRHHQLTFSLWYAFSENFILPLSHDEVVHGKRSLLERMPGDYWQKFANLRLLYGYMAAHPGKKLLFMGGEWGQFAEWTESTNLDWHLLSYELHGKLHRYVRDLNHFCRGERSLWEQDHAPQGFQWIDPHDYSQSVITFIRRAVDGDCFFVVVCNFTPVVREHYRIGVPRSGPYREVFNSDRVEYGGSGQVNDGVLEAEPLWWHNQPCSLQLKIPPLAVAFYKLDES